MKTFLTPVNTPQQYSIRTASGQPIYTAKIPQQPAQVDPGFGLVNLPAPGPVDSMMNFIKKNPLLVIGGAVVVGLLMQKKRSR